FTLPVFDIVLDKVLVDITLVPLEPHKIVKIIFHYGELYMTRIYVSRLLHKMDNPLPGLSSFGKSSE
ncbi:MAG: hypothetical protein ABIN18_19775, partial [Pseudomonadota bacterium]